MTVVTSAGQRHDALGFAPVVGTICISRTAGGRPRTRPGRVLADKAYSSAEAAPAAAHRSSTPRSIKQRNTVERAVNRLRQNRAVATRYDKREFAFRCTITVAAIRIWLRDPAT